MFGCYRFCVLANDEWFLCVEFNDPSAFCESEPMRRGKYSFAQIVVLRAFHVLGFENCGECRLST